MQGFKHGGTTGLVEMFMREVGQPQRARDVITARLRRGVCIPGFRHRLYPDGDPRGKLLLARLAQIFPDAPAVQVAGAIVTQVRAITGKAPTIDFALVALTQALDLPDGSALALFALGRTAGWIGHAIEQYRTGQMIRPRAKYVGM